MVVSIPIATGTQRPAVHMVVSSAKGGSTTRGILHRQQKYFSTLKKVFVQILFSTSHERKINHYCYHSDSCESVTSYYFFFNLLSPSPAQQFSFVLLKVFKINTIKSAQANLCDDPYKTFRIFNTFFYMIVQQTII